MRILLTAMILGLFWGCSSDKDEKKPEESVDTSAAQAESAPPAAATPAPAASTPEPVQAEEMSSKDSKSYECKNGEEIRTITVTDGDENEVCAVEYTKMVDGVEETSKPWFATVEKGFCEQKALVLAETLEGAGWICK